MSNCIFPSNKNMTIKWRRSTNCLYFTLHGTTSILGKAKMTADQIAGYILKNTVLDDTQNTKTENKDKKDKKERLQSLLKEIDALLSTAPSEEDCNFKENIMYDDMTNLKQSLFDVISDK